MELNQNSNRNQKRSPYTRRQKGADKKKESGPYIYFACFPQLLLFIYYGPSLTPHTHSLIMSDSSINLATVSLPAAGDIGFGTSASFPTDISALLTMTETSYDPAAVSSAAAALIQNGEQQASIDAALSGLAENGTSITDSAALAILASASALQSQNGTAAAAEATSSSNGTAVAGAGAGDSISVASAPSGASGVLTNSVPASDSGSALVTASGSGRASGSAKASGSASGSARASGSGSASAAAASASGSTEKANTGAHMVIPAILLAAPLAALL